MIPAYLIFDPQHDYALALMDRLKETDSARPIFIYTDTRSEFYNRSVWPQVRNRDAAATFYLDRSSEQEIVAAINKQFTVVGVVPYYEKALLPAARLLDHLQIDWNSPEVLRRFRDKGGLKDHLRSRGVQVNSTRLVHTAAEVLAQPLPPKYVIKPNDGFANRDVGFFDSATQPAQIEAYFAAQMGDPCLLEAFLEGPEYAINGQMDHTGQAHIVNIIRYERTADNDIKNLYHRTHHVRRSDPEFAAIAAYITQLMQETDLVRCPFHAEIMLTAQGPSLIEVGARLGGSHYAHMANEVHGEGFDIFALAAHYYLHATPYTGSMGNWEHYDSVAAIHVDARVSITQVLYELQGIRELEALPEFRSWAVKPAPGDTLRRTVDLLTVPYAFRLQSYGSPAELVAVADRAEALLRINAQVGALRKLSIKARSLWRRARAKAAWLGNSVVTGPRDP
jgi:glutathione synthase/RimK-type ligase-like ATP-grasp enzyme